MSSKTNRTTSGIAKKSLYKPAPKENIKTKRSNRKPLAQGQLVDLSNSRSTKNYKNGTESLLIDIPPAIATECNISSDDTDIRDVNLTPAVQRRETISTPGKASLSCAPFGVDNEMRRSTLVPSHTSRDKWRLSPTDALFSPLGQLTDDDGFQSQHRTINLDLSDAEFDDKINDTIIEKENQNKVDVFVADVFDEPHQNLQKESFAHLEVSICKEDSIAKVICHTPRSVKKKSLSQSAIINCKKTPCITVSATDGESNSSFFTKESIFFNDMNATQIPNDSSGSEDLNSKKSVTSGKSVTKVKRKGRIVPSRYMQSAKNFVAVKTPKKDANKSHNVTMNRGISKSVSSIPLSCSQNPPDVNRYRLDICNSKSEDGTNNAQTSTPNKDDLPMPYSDASTIMQDVSTISEAERMVKRDLFQCDVRNQDVIPFFPTMEQEKEKPTVDQMDLDILYSEYICSLYLDKMFQHSFRKREEEAMIQMHGLWSEMEKMMEKKSALELKLVEEEHHKIVSQNAQRQSDAIKLVDSSLPNLIPNHQHLATALDTTRHQIASHGIYIPKDEENFTDELIASLQETEELLKKTKVFVKENAKSLSIYSSGLKELTDTVSKENDEIEKLDEILAATESLTVHQASLNIQEIQDLTTIASFQLNI